MNNGSFVFLFLLNRTTFFVTTAVLLLFVHTSLSIGVYVIGFSYPVVPKGKARIRVQISAAHTDEDIDRCIDAFIQTGRKHGVVS